MQVFVIARFYRKQKRTVKSFVFLNELTVRYIYFLCVCGYGYPTGLPHEATAFLAISGI